MEGGRYSLVYCLAIQKVFGRGCAKIGTNKCNASGDFLNGRVENSQVAVMKIHPSSQCCIEGEGLDEKMIGGLGTRFFGSRGCRVLYVQ